MYRWMNIYVYWNDTLEIWINNVRVYNGTPPQRATTFTAPQGFTVAFDPDAGRLEIRYPSVAYLCHVMSGSCEYFGWTQRTALTLSVKRGATQWWGWVRMINTAGADVARRNEYQRAVERHARRALRGEGRRL
jgi:hypothetical protein